MTQAQTARLEGIQRRHTAYEVTSTKAGETPRLVGYTVGKSRATLLRLMRAGRNPDALIALAGIGDRDEITFATKPAIHAAVNGWTIGYTGRTEREAILAGELPRVWAAI